MTQFHGYLNRGQRSMVSQLFTAADAAASSDDDDDDDTQHGPDFKHENSL